MSRKDDLDAMTTSDKEADILRSLREHGAIRFVDRTQLGFWYEALRNLEDKGEVESRLFEVDDQESHLVVTMKNET